MSPLAGFVPYWSPSRSITWIASTHSVLAAMREAKRPFVIRSFQERRLAGDALLESEDRLEREEAERTALRVAAHRERGVAALG